MNDNNANDPGELVSKWVNLNMTDMNRALQGQDPRPAKTEVATADSWNILPMPRKRCTVKLNVFISGDDFKTIEMGHIPEEMEDHWFMYCEEDPDGGRGHIRWYRSWSGYCIYDASYERRGDDVALVSLEINRDGNQYGSTDKESDKNLFLALMAEEIGADPETYWKKFWNRSLR